MSIIIQKVILVTCDWVNMWLQSPDQFSWVLSLHILRWVKYSCLQLYSLHKDICMLRNGGICGRFLIGFLGFWAFWGSKAEIWVLVLFVVLIKHCTPLGLVCTRLKTVHLFVELGVGGWLSGKLNLETEMIKIRLVPLQSAFWNIFSKSATCK